MPPVAHLLGWFEGTAGYNIHARKFAEALARRLPVLRTDLPRKPGEARAVPDGLDASTTNILVAWGELTGYLDGLPGRKAAFVIWETTRLPDSWLAPLGRADQLWVPSSWGAEIVRAHGYDRVEIVPEGYDPDLFHPAVPPAPLIRALPGYKFLHVAKLEHRKGTADLVRAFARAFPGDEPARLVLASQSPEGVVDLRPVLAACPAPVTERITVIPKLVPHHRMASLFTACDAAVFPTRGEAWGLPILEALACGLPVVATGWSAITDYARHAYLLDYRLAPCLAYPVRNADGGFGDWAEPDADHLVELLRRLYADPEAARATGRRAADDARANWTWDVAAAKAEALIRAT